MFTNVIYYLTALNVLTLLVYMDDKINAGGSVGALISIFIGRHKNQHPRFRYGVPVMFLCHVLIVWLIARFSN